MAFANVYGSRCVSIMDLPHASPNTFFAEGFFNNVCILTSAGDVDLGSCTPDATLPNRMILGNNTLYVPGAQSSVTCGGSHDFASWVALGYDVGSTIADSASISTADIISMGRKVLGM